MADDNGEGQEKKRGGGFGRILAFLAAIGAILALLAFWRRRRGSEEEDFEEE